MTSLWRGLRHGAKNGAEHTGTTRVQPSPCFFTAVFDKFDADGDCTINDGEYLLALRSLAEGSTADKLTEIFSIMVRAQAFVRNVAAEVSVTQC